MTSSPAKSPASSLATAPTPSPASSAVRTAGGRAGLGVVLGVVLLGVLLVFAVVLPRLSEDPAGAGEDASAGASGVTLPDTLPGGFTAADLVEDAGEDAEQSAQITESQQQSRAYAQGVLAEVYDAPTDARDYVDADLESFVTVTVIGAPGGAFLPDGIQDPELLGVARPSQELVREGDAVCVVNWGQPVPAGEAVDPAELPVYVSCQRSVEDRTVQLAANNSSTADAVERLDSVFDALG